MKTERPQLDENIYNYERSEQSNGSYLDGMATFSGANGMIHRLASAQFAICGLHAVGPRTDHLSMARTRGGFPNPVNSEV